jgi:hypothetical protein
VSIDAIEDAQVYVYDIRGRLIFEDYTSDHGYFSWKPDDNLSSGIYLLKIEKNGVSKTIKTTYLK